MTRIAKITRMYKKQIKNTEAQRHKGVRQRHNELQDVHDNQNE